MGEKIELAESLLGRIREKRKRIVGYVAASEQRSTRLTNISIICGGLATLFTAGPAIGGQSLTRALTEALGTSAASMPSWRLLCAGATILSFIATTAMAMFRARDSIANLAKAQTASARLEGLEIALEFSTVSVDKTVEQYNLVISDMPFLKD